MTSIEIRQIQLRDLPDVVALWHEIKRAAFPYVEAQRRYTLEDDREYFETVVAREADIWLAEVNNQLAGFMALKAELIDLLFVAPIHQREGVGTALLKKAREINPHRLRAYTFQENLPSQRFFEKHDFEQLRSGVSPPPENEPDVEYEWQPTP